MRIIFLGLQTLTAILLLAISSVTIATADDTNASNKTDLQQNQQSQLLTGTEVIEAANKKALRQPNPKNYTNSIMKFRYTEGALYHIYAAPLRITDIEFQGNEKITSVGAGDTARWQVSKTYSGSGDERQEHLLIKPGEEDLENILVVTTDLRSYHLILTSTENVFMAQVTWSYPQEKKASYDSQEYGTAEPPIDLENLDFGYELKVTKGSLPDWYPTTMFNDGKKTYIKFSPNMQETPTLFVGNDEKNSEVINYRVAGNYYIVDSLIWQAQLRSGENNQYIVQISHK